MTLIHNKINRAWYKPTYKNFKEHAFSKKIFTSKDALDFLKTGSFLIIKARELSEISVPWDESMRYKILAGPRIENALISLGAEYLLKGVFLKRDYSINKVKQGITVEHPVPIKRNKGKLISSEVYGLSYIVDHIKQLVDFTSFDSSQESKRDNDKTGLKGKRVRGIVRMTIPHPSASQLLDYILFKRNYSLHRPFIIPEFVGIKRQTYAFLDYVAQTGANQSIEKLSRLDENYEQ